MRDTLIEVTGLKKHFEIGNGIQLKAVDGVTFTINRGETLGLVGESGCGKSTLGRTMIRLYDRTDGEVLFKGKNVHQLKGKDSAQFNRDVQMIFQDPQASLNPRMTVLDIIAEGLDIHGFPRKDRADRVKELLELVGLSKQHASYSRTNFPAGSGSGSASHALLPSNRNLLSPMSRSLRSTSRFRRRSSICLKICNRTKG